MTVAEDGTRLSSDRQSAAVRVEAGSPLLVKWRRPRPGRRWKTFLRASRERREAQVSLHLLALGIHTPAPLAVAERRSGGRLVGAVLVRPYLAGAETASTWLQSGAGQEASLDLARSLARWHDAGFRHGDCYPKNVLVDLATREAVPIGAPYGRVTSPGARLDRPRARDLAQWAVGLEALGVEDPLAFLAPYAEAAGFGLGPDLEASVRPLRTRILARKAARRAGQAHREPGGAPLPVPLPPDPEPVVRRIRPLVGPDGARCAASDDTATGPKALN